MTSTTLTAADDPARRFSDLIRLHIVCGNAGRWVAIRLSDGGSDGRLYDRGADAIRHQLHETLCGYMPVPVDDLSPRAAAVLLTYWRRAYDNGYRPSDLRPEVHLFPTSTGREAFPV